jgi:ATP-dependent Lhr-like helicase
VLRKQLEPAEPAALARLLADWQGVSASPSASRNGADALLDVIEQLQAVAIPASILEVDVLPARLPGYRSGDLDQLCAAGEVVWAGLGALGERDGRVGLYLAEDLPLLHEVRPEAPGEELHERIRGHLAQQGASFFDRIHEACEGGLERATLDALWDLVWAGEVTNDTPGALRAFLRTHASRSRERRFRSLAPLRSRRTAPPSAAGRWSLLALAKTTATERATARAEQLLARHGVLTRDAVAAEGLAGGFSAVYPVLAALEEAGRIRRGYFVRGLGGSQFAHVGALDRLRTLREAAAGSAAVVLAAADPANPYGAALPWPASGEARLQRAAGAHVFVRAGDLVAYLGRGERELVTFLPAEEPARSQTAGAIALGLAEWAARAGRSFFGETSADGVPLGRSLLAPHLVAAGFARSGAGFRRV